MRRNRPGVDDRLPFVDGNFPRFAVFSRTDCGFFVSGTMIGTENAQRNIRQIE